LPLSNGPGQPLSRFPKFLQHLMSGKPVPIVRSSDAGNLEDGDFDLMFSGKLDPVVGSCRRIDAPLVNNSFEPTEVCELGPRSYCSWMADPIRDKRCSSVTRSQVSSPVIAWRENNYGAFPDQAEIYRA
jgi:hypothetical protein